jgi:uncharacterized damage-inducible protein DinB
MSTNEQLIAELKQESAKTRKMLERVPLDKADWKPHDKSTSIGRLATHVAKTPLWFDRILSADSFDFATATFSTQDPADTNELLQIHDETVAKAVSLLEAATDESLNKIGKLHHGEQVYYELPKSVLLRNFAYNHIYHHRGQLSVYLRLLDVPVPGMYGPSADER